MHIGYIPDRDVIGISKLPRIADMFSRRLQIQERLTKDVAHAIMEVLKPQGVAVVMESSHLCGDAWSGEDECNNYYKLCSWLHREERKDKKRVLQSGGTE
jgi:GTP cyclohydrolase I